jgi:hypothetical protein
MFMLASAGMAMRVPCAALITLRKKNLRRDTLKNFAVTHNAATRRTFTTPDALLHV